MSKSKLLLAEPDLSERQEPAARGTRPSRVRREYAAAGRSTRSQGRDVVVAGSAGFVDEPFAAQPRSQQLFYRDGQIADAPAGGVEHGIGDRGGYPDDHQLAESLDADRAGDLVLRG